MLEIPPFPVSDDRCVRVLSSTSVIEARGSLKAENKWIYIYKHRILCTVLATQLHKGISNASHQAQWQQKQRPGAPLWCL